MIIRRNGKSPQKATQISFIRFRNIKVRNYSNNRFIYWQTDENLALSNVAAFVMDITYVRYFKI